MNDTERARAIVKAHGIGEDGEHHEWTDGVVEAIASALGEAVATSQSQTAKHVEAIGKCLVLSTKGQEAMNDGLHHTALQHFRWIIKACEDAGFSLSFKESGEQIDVRDYAASIRSSNEPERANG